jgi:hypothetical protein
VPNGALAQQTGSYNRLATNHNNRHCSVLVVAKNSWNQRVLGLTRDTARTCKILILGPTNTMMTTESLPALKGLEIT